LKALDRSLTLEQTAALMGGTLQRTDSDLSWRVALASSEPTVILDVRGDAAIETIRLGFDTDSPLRLRDLSTEFGNYRPIHEGEESSVRFVSPSGIHISAWLFSSRILADASVLRIFFRAQAPSTSHPG